MKKQMRRKVLIIGPGPKTMGGITSVITAHSNSFIWQKWNCLWIPTHREGNKFNKILCFITGLFKYILNLHNSTIIHIHFSEPYSAFRKWIFLSIAYLLNKKTILHFHAFSVNTTIYGKHKSLYKKMFNKANVIIALSSIWKEHIKTLVDDAEKIKILYNPCPKVNININSKKENSILFAGALVKRKGYQDLICAFSLIADKYKDWKIVFAGNGEIEEGKHLCTKMGIIDQVVFKGWVSGEEKEILFNSSTLFCLPSYAEGFPMAVLDAWAYGLPVITTPVGGLPDILKHRENAMVFEPGDIESLAVNIDELITNSKLREKLSDESFHLSNNDFSLNVISKQLDSIYENLDSI